MSGHDDPKPDPRLVAALRHAPDADVQAPPEVTARVMAAARAAVAPGSTRWRFAWPKPWALGASGALATVVMAGFIALLWRGEPAVEPVVAPAPAPAPPAKVASPTPPFATTEPQRMPPAAPALEQRRPAAPPQALAKDARKREPGATERARRELANAESARPQSADAAVTAPAPAPAPAPPQVLAEKAPPMAAAAAPSSAPRSAGLANTFAPLGASQQPLAWEIDGQVPKPADLAWLRELDRVAQAHWRWGDEVEAPADARRIRLSGVGGRAALVVTERFVQWCDGQAQRCRQATLDPMDGRRLIEMLPRP